MAIPLPQMTQRAAANQICATRGRGDSRCALDGELCIDVKFPHGTRKLEIPRLYAKAKYMGTIKKRKKLIFRLRKLDTWGVEWPGKVNHWPQIYWDTKFGKHVTG